MGDYVFDNVPTSTCMLKVPYGTADIYREADQWREFMNIIEIKDFVMGDISGDGAVDGLDINLLISILLGKDNAANYDDRADLDDSGTVDGSDINLLINILLGK